MHRDALIYGVAVGSGRVVTSCSPYREVSMLDALFWYTGLVVWILIVFAGASTILVDMHDRSILARKHDAI